MRLLKNKANNYILELKDKRYMVINNNKKYKIIPIDYMVDGNLKQENDILKVLYIIGEIYEQNNGRNEERSRKEIWEYNSCF